MAGRIERKAGIGAAQLVMLWLAMKYEAAKSALGIVADTEGCSFSTSYLSQRVEIVRPGQS